MLLPLVVLLSSPADDVEFVATFQSIVNTKRRHVEELLGIYVASLQEVLRPIATEAVVYYAYCQRRIGLITLTSCKHQAGINGGYQW